jgi:hypothetical protein
MSNTKQFVDVTSELENVSGGNGRGRAIVDGVRRGYQVARPILKETAEVVKDVGVIGGVAYGAKRAWDSMTGGNNPPQRPQPQPQP